MRPAALQALAVWAGVVLLPHVVSAADSSSAVHVQGAMLPLSFESRPVAGGTVYVARGTGYSIVVEPGGASLILGGGPVATEDVVVSLAFDPAVSIVPIPESRLRATASYLVGARADWRTDVPLYGRVRLPQAWPGIDVVFYGIGRQLEYDLIVSPGTSVDQVRLRFRGGDRVRLDDRGDLLIATPAGTIRQRKPYAFQEDARGLRTPVASQYTIDAGGAVGIAVGPHDPTRQLTIDPVIAYATYLGGPGVEFWQDSAIAGVAVGPDGDVFVAGDTTNVAFGAGDVHDLRRLPAARDIFIARLNAQGSSLISLTFIGGSGRDDRVSLVRAPDGTLLLAGRTQSDNLPVTAGAIQTTLAGTQDAFVARLDADAAALIYLTYMGGSGLDYANAIAVTPGGDAVVAGGTTSPDFPRVGAAAQAGFGGATDAFVAQIAAREAGGVAFATILGGSGTDIARGVGVTTSGHIVIAGQTESDNLPLTAALQPQRHGGADAFVAGYDGTGAPVFASYIGGGSASTIEGALGLAAGPSSTFVVVGATDAADFPTTSAVQPGFGGVVDGFAASFAWNGVALTKRYATYLGGSGTDVAFGAAVDPAGATTITGGTQSPEFPPDVNAFDSSLGGTQDAFVVRLARGGDAYYDASYYGGSGVETGLAVALDGLGDAFIVGQTTSVDLLTLSSGGGTAADAVANGAEDAFAIRIAADADRDGLPDAWERAWGLDPDDASGVNGAEGDADRDWLTNLAEYRGGTNPYEAERFFAEGANGTAVGFDTRFAILNPHQDVTFDVLMEFHTGNQQTYTYMLDSIGPGQRVTVDARRIPGVPELASAAFSTVIRSPFGVLADRTMTWSGQGYGSHAETAVLQPSTVWYLAEGATHSGFDLFYLLQNPQASPARVRVTYLRPAPAAPLVQIYTVPPRSRFNIWVNQERFPDANGDRLLAEEEVSAVIEVLNGVAIVVERAMYRSRPGRPPFDAGHESAGVTSTSTRWFLAEGATTKGFFDLFILVANPGDVAAEIRVTYLLPDGSTLVRKYGGSDADHPAIAARSRQTIWVDYEDARLEDTAVSTIVESTNGAGVVVERSMWWPGPTPDGWIEAHNSFGTTATGTLWGMAEGEQGGVEAWDTYILIANTSSHPGRARVTLRYEDGTEDSTIVDLNASSRLTVPVGSLGFARAANARFGAIVQALPASSGAPVPQIVVERAMYSGGTDRGAQGDYPVGWPYWPAGTNAVATRLR